MERHRGTRQLLLRLQLIRSMHHWLLRPYSLGYLNLAAIHHFAIGEADRHYRVHAMTIIVVVEYNLLLLLENS